MGYKKVYLTIEEEEDLARLQAARVRTKAPGSAANAILKEGLAMVVNKELLAGGVLHVARRVR